MIRFQIKWKNAYSTYYLIDKKDTDLAKIKFYREILLEQIQAFILLFKL